jgi:hypothetical protein
VVPAINATDPSGKHIAGFKYIERTGLFCIYTTAALFIEIILFSALPSLLPPSNEEAWATIWAQSALIVFVCLRILRFKIRPAGSFERFAETIKLSAIVFAYVYFRYDFGVLPAGGFLTRTAHFLIARAVHLFWPVEIDFDDARRLLEVMLFSLLAAYLLLVLTRTIMDEQIRETAREHEERALVITREELLRDGRFSDVVSVDNILGEVRGREAGRWWSVVLIPILTGVAVNVVTIVVRYFFGLSL